MIYYHFTDLHGAQAIKKSGKLLPSTFGASGIFAIAHGGHYSPGVQRSTEGRAKNREVAIVFTTKYLPDKSFPEEVVWHLGSLPVKVISIIPAEKAIHYLDDSIPEDSETGCLQISTHPAVYDPESGWIRLAENFKPWVPGVDTEKYTKFVAIYRKTGRLQDAEEFWQKN